MKIIKIKLKNRTYKIVVGRGILKFLPEYIRTQKLGQDAYVITNGLLKKIYGKRLTRILEQGGISVKFKLIPDSEKSKSLDTAYAVLKDLAKYDRKRDIFIVSFGGGVVGDLAGFTASIYKRGIPYIQVPTTLLAQVDSSIGGKTAVDLEDTKNLIGSFYQPRLVVSDVDILKTLTLRQIKSGLAEVIKYAIIKDKGLFTYLTKNLKKILASDSSALEFIVRRCAMIKAKIVEADEKEEKGLRTVLNFGHTFGHAIEAAAGFKTYNHGEAVALGMLLACGLSLRLGLLDGLTRQKIESLIRRAGLPLKIKNLPWPKLIKAHYRDKKFQGGKNRFVLISKIGKTVIKENIPLPIIKGILKLNR